MVRLRDRTPAHCALKLAVEVRTGSRPNTTWRRTRGRSCHSWIQQIGTASEPSGQELVIVGMAGRRNGPPLSTRYHDDDDDDDVCVCR